MDGGFEVYLRKRASGFSNGSCDILDEQQKRKPTVLVI
jgi:hypothetical protein